MARSQIKTDKRIKDFLGDMTIKTPEDLVSLRTLIQKSLEFRPYNKQTKKHADSIQWKRTASQILQDGYVYKGKACSDLSIVFLALCKAAGVEGFLVKLIRLDKKSTHSIVEVKLKDNWYRLDITMTDSVPFEGQLAPDQVWNKGWQGGWKVWKRGRDVWDLGLTDIKTEDKICKKITF